MSIDPSTQVQRPTMFVPLAETPLDPAEILLALSAQQMTILQDAAASRINSTRTLLDTLGRVGSTARDATRVHDDIQSRELLDAQGMLDQLRGIAQLHPSGEVSNLTVNAADNDRLGKLADWAGERGWTIDPLTSPLPPTDTEQAAASAAGETSGAAQPQWQVNADAFAQAVDRLANYVAELRNGSADNPRLTQLILQNPAVARVQGELNLLGFDLQINSLADLRTARQQLDQQAASVLVEADRNTQLLGVHLEAAQKVLAGMSGVLQQTARTESREWERKWDAVREQLDKLEWNEQERETLDRVLQQTISGEEFFRSIPMPALELPGSLSDLLDQQAAARLADWQGDLEARLRQALYASSGSSSSGSVRRWV